MQRKKHPGSNTQHSATLRVQGRYATGALETLEWLAQLQDEKIAPEADNAKMHRIATTVGTGIELPGREELDPTVC